MSEIREKLEDDLDAQIHYVQFEKIESFRYVTIFLDELISEDPKKIIDYINKRKEEDGIDFIKVKVRVPVPGNNKTIINNYYRNNPTTFVEFLNLEEVQRKKKEAEALQNKQYSYLTDRSISDLERFVMYVNDCEGSEFITVQQLNNLLKNDF